MDLEWWDANVDKLAEHGVGQDEVEEMIESGNFLVADSPYFGQVRVTGYTSGGRWLTIAMEELAGDRFRPITGWEATEREIRQYLEEDQ